MPTHYAAVRRRFCLSARQEPFESQSEAAELESHVIITGETRNSPEA